MHSIVTLKTILLAPLSGIYWLITSLRNWCYDLGLFQSTSFDIPIISVGNLAVGGSGKTPMVEYLIKVFSDEYSIAVLSRGYGRKTKGFLWVEEHLNPSKTGDEPLQVKTKFPKIYFAVCEDRVAGVKRILKEKPETSLILLDDAFQHRAIQPKIQLLLSEYYKPFYSDWLMPRGRLRESRNGAKRADAIIFTKCTENVEQKEWNSKPVFYSRIAYEKTKLASPIFGFSGLANNKHFSNHLSNNYDLQDFKGFKDHYGYRQQDLDSLIKEANGAQLVCTEKDWIKVRKLAGGSQIKHIPIVNRFENENEILNWLKARLNES